MRVLKIAGILTFLFVFCTSVLAAVQEDSPAEDMQEEFDAKMKAVQMMAERMRSLSASLENIPTPPKIQQQMIIPALPDMSHEIQIPDLPKMEQVPDIPAPKKLQQASLLDAEAQDKRN